MHVINNIVGTNSNQRSFQQTRLFNNVLSEDIPNFASIPINTTPEQSVKEQIEKEM